MRNDYVSWDECFMAMAMLIAQRSKDPSTQVGACIVNEDHIVMGLGYNGLPRGLSDSDYPWSKKDGNFSETKYPYVVHAEMNAILNSQQRVRGCRMYVTLFPCNECSKAIIQSGITTLVYFSDKHAHTESTIASKKMLQDAGVHVVEFENQALRLKVEK